jgi:hypothetical protein
MHSPSHVHRTYVVGAMTITRDVASVPKGLVPRCAALIFQNSFERLATPPNTMAKLIPVFGWRIIASRVEREG